MSQHEELIQGIHECQLMYIYVLLKVEKQTEKHIDLDCGTDRHEHSLQTEDENPTSEISNVQQNTVRFYETPQSATPLTQNRVPLKDTETIYTLTQSDIHVPCVPEMDNTDDYTCSYNTTQKDYNTNQRSQYQQPAYQETTESLLGQPLCYQTYSNNSRKKKPFYGSATR